MLQGVPPRGSRSLRIGDTYVYAYTLWLILLIYSWATWSFISLLAARIMNITLI